MKPIYTAALLIFTHTLYASPDLVLKGTTEHTVHLAPNASNHSMSAIKKSEKKIKLLNFKLSPHAWGKIDEQLSADDHHQFDDENKDQIFEKKIQLGMNNVPVFDQGPYGTCVTFAITAAIEAAMQKGDTISQLCQLELGQFLEQYSNRPSGWQGSMGLFVLNQIDNFGYLDKETEKTGICGGLSTYPEDGVVPETRINLKEFSIYHSSIDEEPEPVSWSTIMDHYHAFVDDVDRNEVLNSVKEALLKGDRLTFGVLLISPDLCTIGACGHFKKTNDSWIITPLIKSAIKSHSPIGGHEMVITGFDDNAIAYDQKGRAYKGLLTLRNSWGINLGDNGDFYMSYDYFKELVVEVNRIRQLSNLS